MLMLRNILNRVLMLLLFVSCVNDDTSQFELRGENGFSYKESLEQWKKLKKDNGNSYVYKTVFVSWMFNYGSSTELKIENGIVVERNYEVYNFIDENGEKEIIDSYIENVENIGTHQEGALPKTIDELYNTCAGDYLIVNSKDNVIYFETNENGILSLCGFVPEGCMDDCYRGIQVEFIKWGK